MRFLVDGPPIQIGYEWRQRLVMTTVPPMFPAGCALTSHVRAMRTAAEPIAVLTTANGGIVRISDNEVEIIIGSTMTAAMIAGTVVLDVVRTDTDPDAHLGFTLTIPVALPVTRIFA